MHEQTHTLKLERTVLHLVFFLFPAVQTAQPRAGVSFYGCEIIENDKYGLQSKENKLSPSVDLMFSQAATLAQSQWTGLPRSTPRNTPGCWCVSTHTHTQNTHSFVSMNSEDITSTCISVLVFKLRDFSWGFAFCHHEEQTSLWHDCVNNLGPQIITDTCNTMNLDGQLTL